MYIQFFSVQQQLPFSIIVNSFMVCCRLLNLAAK